MSKLSDISLVQQVLIHHNKLAFEQLVVRYQEPIRRFLLGQTLGDKALSDDLAQDTFVKAYTRLYQFKGQSKFSTWLYRIAYRVYYDYLRSHKYTTPIDATILHNKSSNEAPQGLRMDIYKALAILNDVERICVTLQLIDSEPIDKIAEVTSLPVGTVKSHLFRGKQKLVTYLKKQWL